jgi:hypothetical protein
MEVFVKHLMVLALTMLVCGCSAVFSESPMGGQAERADPSAWDGVWASLDSSDEGAVTVHVIDADAGALQVEYVEHDKPVRMRFFLRRWGQWTFLSVVCAQGDNGCDDTRDRYLWSAYRLRDDALVMWTPIPARFGELVDQGLLPGERLGSDVELSIFEDRHYELITADEHAGLWDWREPLVLMRIARN